LIFKPSDILREFIDRIDPVEGISEVKSRSFELDEMIWLGQIYLWGSLVFLDISRPILEEGHFFPAYKEAFNEEFILSSDQFFPEKSRRPVCFSPLTLLVLMVSFRRYILLRGGMSG